MENEWEQTAISHEATRQMLFATKQLPRTVNAPEWVQFGMGSFFETSLQAPWPSIGGTNPYWLPRFKELSKQKVRDANLATLKKVVTDGYFREKPRVRRRRRRQVARGDPAQGQGGVVALTYYLANTEQHLPRLQKYFKEISKQPRDVELDEKALWACFTKAFAGEDMKALADGWVS